MFHKVCKLLSRVESLHDRKVSVYEAVHAIVLEIDFATGVRGLTAGHCVVVTAGSSNIFWLCVS